jgi:hypothetical protein
MARKSAYSPILFPVAVAAVLFGMERFVDSQNICLFRQDNDLSTPAKRKAYAECMLDAKYNLKTGCEEGATASACYDYDHGP